ncbi:ubiquitin carboxyl-terminal hydrolase 1-like [Diadema antillarum]|uniref:ubiquitin carboxyl-terminal hydrolase 1-like n=1 Tax=Diadema antillarum TaxID=105358 RepID=UPI003A86F432
MATSDHPLSPPRKRAKLSLKLIRQELHPTPKEEPTEDDKAEGTRSEADDNTQPCFPEAGLPQPAAESSSCIPREYVVTVAPYTGLHNLGNTCYLNSVLQVLRYCPGFSENVERLSRLVAVVIEAKEREVREDQERDEAVCKEEERARRNRKEFLGQLKLVHKLNVLFNTMSDKERFYLDRMMPSGQELAMYPEDILEAIRDLNPMFKGYLQHDAQELLCCILSNVQEACQRLCAQQQGTPHRKGSDPLPIPAPSNPCVRAVRKLDMERTGDCVPLEMVGGGDGRLLGGARTSVDKGSCFKKINHSDQDALRGKSHQNGKGDASTISSCNGSKDGVTAPSELKSKLSNGLPSKSKNKLERLHGNQPGEISPSNDSVRRRGNKKSGLSNGHAPGNECNGSASSPGHHGDKNGESNCLSSKKKRLGIGRIHQSTLHKFTVVKKEKTEPSDNHETDSSRTSKTSQDTERHSADLDSTTKLQGTSEMNIQRNVTTNNSNNNEELSEDTQEHSVSSEIHHSEISKKEPNQSIHENNEQMLTGENPFRTDGNSCRLEQDVNDAAVEEEKELTQTARREESEVDLVERMFRGTLVLQTRCQECESCSEKREDFQDVSVPVQSIPPSSSESDDEDQEPDTECLSLSWALSEFTSVERLTDDNKYYCEHCHHHTEAERSVLFGRLPDVLIIQLKRFSAFINCFSPGGSVTKVNDHLAVPLTLSLARWCASSCSQRGGAFELCAVVAHSGISSSSGHYMAYARVPERSTPSGPAEHSSSISSTSCQGPGPAMSSSSSWANFDDDRVHVMSEDDFSSLLNPLPGSETSATPYLLFYRQKTSSEMK